MSKRQAKAAINKIDADLNSNNLVSTGTIINNPRDALLLALNPTNDFFLDQENKDKIIKIAEDFSIKQTNLQQQETTLNNRNNDLTNELTSIVGITTPQANAKRITIATEQATIVGQLATIGTMLGNIGPRQAEYQVLANLVNEFDIQRALPDMKGNIYNIGPDFMAQGATANGFNFYNELGAIINFANYWIDIKLTDGTIQNLQIHGLPAITAPNGTIDLTGITFTDRTGAIYTPTQGYEFILNPGAIRTIGLGRNFISTKSLKVIRGPAGAVNTVPLREAEVDAYNNAGVGNVINNSMNRFSTANIARREREAIFRAISNNDGPKFDKLSAEQKEDMYQNIRRLISPPNGINQLIPATNFNYNEFRRRITGDRHPGNTLENTASARAYRNYINNNLETLIPQFFARQMDGEFIDNINRNTFLKSEVTRYLSEMEHQKIDNNDHMRLDQNIPNDRPQAHPNSRWQRMLRRGSNKNNRTKFFDGRESQTLQDKLETNEGELGFDLKVAIHGVNKIVTTINIKGEDEPIILDTKDVNEMTHMILRLEATKSGEPIQRKLRCRMAMNAVKAVVSMSPVTLHRQYQGNIRAIDGQQYNVDRISAHIRGENLVIRGSCATSHVNRQRTNHVIFDEQRYKGLHNIDELERGMVGLSNQVNNIMDAMGTEFREATSRIKTGPLMTYNTTKYLRGGPIKKLRARMAYGKTNRKFDFDTTATSGSKAVNIKFEKGVFTLSGTFKDKPFEYKGKSLGVLLRKKIDRLRVFDGVELAIFEKINESMVEKLRTNNLIGPENFGVTDFNQDKTGRVFMMDNHGDLSYIEIEDRNLNPLRNRRTYGRINTNDMPPQRIRCNEKERREFMQNPLLSGRLIRAMRQRLQLI